MTHQERENVMEAVTEAVLTCRELPLPPAERIAIAVVVRRDVARRLDDLTKLPGVVS